MSEATLEQQIYVKEREVRALKAASAPMDQVDQTVAQLLRLKAQFGKQMSEEALQQQITDKVREVRALKEARAPKDQVVQAVAQLLELKAQFRTVTGHDPVSASVDGEPPEIQRWVVSNTEHPPYERYSITFVKNNGEPQTIIGERYPFPTHAVDMVATMYGPDGTADEGFVLVVVRAKEACVDQVAICGGVVPYGRQALAQGFEEMLEETGFQPPKDQAVFWVGNYDHPDRDPRKHFTSEAYTQRFAYSDQARKLPEVITTPDEVRQRCWMPLKQVMGKIERNELAFDHGAILCDAIFGHAQLPAMESCEELRRLVGGDEAIAAIRQRWNTLSSRVI